MLIFGHRFIPSETLYHIDDTGAIANTPANSILFFPFDESNLDLIAYCRENDLRFAMAVGEITELLFAENLGASYLVVEESLAKSAQKIAETYLFDAKVLCRVHEETKMAAMAFEGVDGVLFPEAIVKVSG